MKITLPDLSLVILIGPSGSGKSTFAKKYFLETEVLSSDFFRGLVSNDTNDQSASKMAFDALHYIAEKRLERGLLTVIDATNLQEQSRQKLIHMARKYHCIPVAIVFQLPEQVCQKQNLTRTDRVLSNRVIRSHYQQLRQQMRKIKREGFRYLYQLHSLEELEQVYIERQPSWTNKRTEKGPFDIIGDVHGCFEELVELLGELNYRVECMERDGDRFYQVTHPEDRRVIFIGDLVDRGPNSPEVLRLVMSMAETGIGLCVPGNHDDKLLRKLKGHKVQIQHGLAETLEQLENETPSFIERIRNFIGSLVSHYVLDDGKLVVAHAGLSEKYHGRASRTIRDLCLYGRNEGLDENGFPVRTDWAKEYRGRAQVVFGHTPHKKPLCVNHTVNMDTGCVFGGELTALRYPEQEFISVKAKQVYMENDKFQLEEEKDVHCKVDHTLSVHDLPSRIETRYLKNIRIREEQKARAIETMSQSAIMPQWLIYLPPTISPSESSKLDSYLEHPSEAITYYQQVGVEKVICEVKHMGSRAMIIVCQNDQVAIDRFGLTQPAAGVVYTRTGRKFFQDPTWERSFLLRLRKSLDQSHFWEKHQTNWVLFDGELMPWSAKAQELIKQQYAAVGSASVQSLTAGVEILEKSLKRGLPVQELLEDWKERNEDSQKFVDAYRRYCWKVEKLEDLQYAPFHLLATEGKVHVDKDHLWHMMQLSNICQQDPEFLVATNYQVVDVQDPESVSSGIAWWENLTNKGYEGMVVKPLSFVPKNEKGLIQPAIKSRGKEYLRIIYGATYTSPDHLEKLQKRNLKRKQHLALQEFSLGIEALQRFVEKEPLGRIHECIFGIMSLESEPIDPRL